MTTAHSGFSAFYNNVFLGEHRHPMTVALHAFGTVVGIAYLVWVILLGWPWLLLALAFPLVHAVPGLIGHRLFERNQAVGDLRVMRKDHPAWWFVVANHVMTWQLLARGFYWRA